MEPKEESKAAAFGAVVLLGPPGVGKSLLATALCRHSPDTTDSLNVGEELRKEGLVQPYLEHPTEAGRLGLARRAQELVAEACRSLAAERERGHPKVLVLEYVKDLEDAYTLLEVLQEQEVPLLQVLYLTDKVTPHLISDVMGVAHFSGAGPSAARDEERLVKERQAKWVANAPSLLEFFSSLGVLAEAVAGPPSPLVARSKKAAGPGRAGQHQQWREVPAGTLAAIGYAPCFASSAGSPAAAPTAASSQATGPGMWVQAVGWCSQEGLLTAVPRIYTHWIEPVVSARLVTSAAERRSVLASAAAATGLHCLAEGRAPFAVPAETVACPSDARWVGWPGRYCVSRKCDGTRYLLLVAEGGAYLLNRAGMLYCYPIQAEAAGGSGSGSGSGSGAAGLPSSTCLDGELMWVGPPGAPAAARQGFFLAFDVLSVGQQRTWQQPLAERLQELQGLGLQEAESSAALQAAAASSSAASTCGGGAAAPGGSAGGGSASGSAAQQRQLAKKQQAPPLGSDSITLLLKPPLPVTPEVLEQLAAALPAPYPTDGLVFTPAAFPYCIGMAELLMKWQPPEQAGADITGADLQEAASECRLALPFASRAQQTRRRGRGLVGRPSAAKQQGADARDALEMCKLADSLPAGLVYECGQLHPPAPPAAAPAASEATTTATATAAAAGLSQAEAQRQQRSMHSMQQRMLHSRPWVPRSVRWDKRQGNPPETVACLARRAAQGHYLSLPMLVAGVREAAQAAASTPALPGNTSAATTTTITTTTTSPSCGSGSSGPIHPARLVPFDQLYESVMEEVSAVRVERSVDSVGSGLNVFCYRQALGVPRTAVATMCRGLVLHPPSRQVVATPFVRFGEPGEDAAGAGDTCTASAGSMEGAAAGEAGGVGGSLQASPLLADDPGSTCESELAWLPGGQADLANLALYHGGGGSMGSASPKLDGTLVIAFMWGGRLYTATRRRMDSEQALWAKEWLSQRARLGALLPGWTYLFEAIYQDNAHVVQYPFESLVLLAAVGPDGREVRGTAARQELGRSLEVPAAPSMEGPWQELLFRLGRGTAGPAAATEGARGSSGSGGKAPTHEGWVLQASCGERCKLVQAAFKRAGAAAEQLHPLLVWDAVRCGGASRGQLAAGLPAHMQRELHSILDALERQYCGVEHLLWDALAQGQLVPPAKPGSAAEQAQLEQLLQKLRLEEPPASPAAGLAPDLFRSPELQAALSYAQQVHSADAGPMFLHPSSWPVGRMLQRPGFNSGKSRAPMLRGLVLAAIRPQVDGSLPGYSPSPSFAHTHAKGWARDGPAGSRGSFLAARAAGEEVAADTGVGRVAGLVLPYVDGQSMAGSAALVCKEWRQLIREDPTCQAAIKAARRERESEVQAMRGAMRRELFTLLFGYGGYGYDDELGYGSP